MAQVTFLYFAWLRERVGCSEEVVDLPDGLATPLDVAGWLQSRGVGYADGFADPAKLRCAVDQQMVPMTSPLGSAKEIAFFPPVTGG